MQSSPQAIAENHSARQPIADQPECLTNDQTAAWLNIAPGVLHNWRRQGRGPAFIKVGRFIRYRRADVDAWLAANRCGGEAAR